MIRANGSIQGNINQYNFTVTTSNFIGTIPSVEQNLYGTILLLKKYLIDEYEYIPLGSIDLNESAFDDAGYTARFLTHSYNFATEKSFGFLGFAIPSINRIISALGQATYLSNRNESDYYIYNNELWYLETDDISDILPNEISGNWVLIDVLSANALNILFKTKSTSNYEYYYDNYFLLSECREETWTHTQACLEGKVVVSGISNLGNTYGPTITTMDCDLNQYDFSLECRGGIFYIIRHNVEYNTYDYYPTSYSCDTSSRTPDYYLEMICSENCKPTVWQAVVRDHNDPDYQMIYETNIECCDCDDTPPSEIVCDEENGTLRVNISESSCGGFYSVLTDIPCVSIPDCPSILKLVKNACNNFTLIHDGSPIIYYPVLRSYDNPMTSEDIANYSLATINFWTIGPDRTEVTLDLSNWNDGMYLLYMIYVSGNERKYVIIPLYILCAMQACMNKMIKSILCMCDCTEEDPCNQEVEKQRMYELNKLIAIIQPVMNLIRLRTSLDGQILPNIESLSDDYYDLSMTIKKMNLMIDRCGLCNDEEIDCGCN